LVSKLINFFYFQDFATKLAKNCYFSKKKMTEQASVVVAKHSIYFEQFNTSQK